MFSIKKIGIIVVTILCMEAKNIALVSEICKDKDMCNCKQ